MTMKLAVLWMEFTHSQIDLRVELSVDWLNLLDLLQFSVSFHCVIYPRVQQNVAILPAIPAHIRNRCGLQTPSFPFNLHYTSTHFRNLSVVTEQPCLPLFALDVRHVVTCNSRG